MAIGTAGSSIPSNYEVGTAGPIEPPRPTFKEQVDALHALMDEAHKQMGMINDSIHQTEVRITALEKELF